MSFDAQKEEQKAIQFLNQGKVEDALKSYKLLLRKDSKSRRLRKTVADLSLRLGLKREAEQMLIVIADTDVKEKQYRIAIPIYRELIKMRPKDHEMHLEMAHCMIESNFESDALIHLKKAVEMTQRLKPEVAQEVQYRIVQMSPGELSERRTYAELLESANWSDKASDAWKEFAELNRKVGQIKEAARSIERALKNREDWEMRLEAAQCRFEAKEPRKALEHLQQVYKDYPTNPKVLALLATGLQMVGHDAKAKQLWLESAKRYDEVVKKAAAFEEAIQCGATEKDLPEDYANIQRHAKADVLRLHQCGWASSSAKVEQRFIIKTRLLIEFKRYSDALACIQGAEGLEKRPSIFALLIESLVLNEKYDEAIEQLQTFKNKDPQIMEDVQLRLLGLGLSDEDSEELIDDDLLDDDLEDLDSISEDLESASDDISATSSQEATVETLIVEAKQRSSAGDISGALEILNTVLEQDPTHIEALQLMGVLALQDTSTPTPSLSDPVQSMPAHPSVNITSDPFSALATDPFASVASDPFSSSASDPFATVSSDPFSSAVDMNPVPISGGGESPTDILMTPPFKMVNQYLKIGFHQEAERALEGIHSLDSSIVQTRLLIAKEQYRKALDVIQDAIDEFGSSDPSYLLALWELARVYSLQQRVRNTNRTLDEIVDIDATFRSMEIEIWRDALQLLD